MNATRLTLTALFCAALAACSSLGIGVTPIGDIVANPSRFDNTEVRVKGKVVSVNKVPLVGLKLYTLKDDSGEMTVVAAGDTLPAQDSTVLVRAKVESAAIVQGQALGLRLSEIERSSPLF
ncbi:MAG TPA: hypothetical protein VF816_10120 [Rhodocyclaceae bacterium]